MFDIFYVQSSDNLSNWKKLKSRFPIAKRVTSFADAKELALTKFFWIVWDDLVISEQFNFDYIPDQWSENYVHVFKNAEHRDGIILVSKNVSITNNEIKHRFFIKKKEIDLQASSPKNFDYYEVETYSDYLTALEKSTTELFWVSSPNILVDNNLIHNFYISHHEQIDRKQNHAFVHLVDDVKYYNGLFLCSKYAPLTQKEVDYRHVVNRKEWDIVGSGPIKYDIFNVKNYDDYLTALNTSHTEMFWIVPDYVNPTERFKYDTYFTHDQEFERKINHTFLNGKYHDGILLCSKYAKFSKREFDYKFIANKKEINIIISTPKPYDIVFISYQEPSADEYYRYLANRFPHAKRVHGVKGIHQAHIEAAKLCDTDMFWIVDGDALIDSNFKFDYQVARWDRDTVHVWRSVNPINDLVYGYGGVKLFPTELTLNMDTSKPDMTTSISSKFKAVQEISNVTGFNTDSFNTWKSAFRECVKLSSRVIDRQKDDETQTRLQTWCTKGADRPFGKYAIDGAKMGALFGARNKGNLEMLKNINDFDWLKEQFNARNI